MNIKNMVLGLISQNDLLNYYNISLNYEKLPQKINGFVFNYNNVNFIILNSNISYYKRRKTLIHELAHVELNHLLQKNNDMFELSIDKYEDEADIYVKKIMDIEIKNQN